MIQLLPKTKSYITAIHDQIQQADVGINLTSMIQSPKAPNSAVRARSHQCVWGRGNEEIGIEIHQRALDARIWMLHFEGWCMKANILWLHWAGTRADSHQCTASINPFLCRHWAYRDKISFLVDWQPVVLPDGLGASEDGGEFVFFSVGASKRTPGSYLHFPTLCLGAHLGWLI